MFNRKKSIYYEKYLERIIFYIANKSPFPVKKIGSIKSMLLSTQLHTNDVSVACQQRVS